MDPVSVVLAALAAGLSVGLTDTAKGAVADAYQVLKARLKKVFSRDPQGDAALTLFESNPETNAFVAVLGDALKRHEHELDEDVLAAAKAVTAAAGPVAGRPGGISAQALQIWADHQGTAIGVARDVNISHGSQSVDPTMPGRGPS